MPLLGMAALAGGGRGQVAAAASRPIDGTHTPESIMKVASPSPQPRGAEIAASGILISLVTGLLLVGACSDAAGPRPVANVVTIHGVDFSYDAPNSIPAGRTTIKFIN